MNSFISFEKHLILIESKHVALELKKAKIWIVCIYRCKTDFSANQNNSDIPTDNSKVQEMCQKEKCPLKQSVVVLKHHLQ